MYKTVRLDIEKTPLLDKLARASGELYSRILVSYWRVLRKKGIFLSNYSMQRWHISSDLHAHTCDAIADNFYASIRSANQRKKAGDTQAKYPRRRKYFYKITWKSAAIRLKDGKLVLANGRGNKPLIFDWQWDQPKQVEIGWKQSGGYQLRATYPVAATNAPVGNLIAAVDLGELRSATTHDGQETVIYNGRLIKSKVAYRNKITAQIQERISKTKRGSNRRKKLVRAKSRIVAKINHQIKDILHKQTQHIVSTLHKKGVQTLVIGDIRDIRKSMDYGKEMNQRLHSWSFGKFRELLSYKAKILGMQVVLQNEKDTTKTCPGCGKKHKPKGRLYKCRSCGFKFDRDGVGAINIRSKYLGCLGVPVVGVMATPVGVRYRPHLQCSSMSRRFPVGQ
ncbi:MAG: transposase [Chroococcidiopsidaceae cyanobacterium CP_BM_ER_R8_30]|nr:transposase [Chroococcidiopsidaceae cyanobacterium CP_BM_ER_R8_30]